MVVSWWRHKLQCIVIVQSFLRLLKLHKLAVGKLDLLRGGLTRCHGVLDHGLNLWWNIPLTFGADLDKGTVPFFSHFLLQCKTFCRFSSISLGILHGS